MYCKLTIEEPHVTKQYDYLAVVINKLNRDTRFNLESLPHKGNILTINNIDFQVTDVIHHYNTDVNYKLNNDITFIEYEIQLSLK